MLEHGKTRGEPRLSDALSTTGAIPIAVGLLLIAADTYADNRGRPAEVGMFVILVLVGYLALFVLPPMLHPAGTTLVAIGVPGALGWWLLPHAHKFGDIRPFLILTIVLFALCFVAPGTRGRVIFAALVALFLWFWIVGEVAGSDAYSAAPIPSPPAHTMFSLAALHDQTPTVTIDDLDSSDPLYPLAQQCDEGGLSACDSLYRSAPDGSDFKTFGGECGGMPGAVAGECASFNSGSVLPLNPLPVNPRLGATSRDKSLEVGLVSVFFGLLYLALLYVLDRRRLHGLATAFTVPAFIALFSGTESLGNAAHHAWVGGLLTVVAGIAFGVVGNLGGRRFTTWAGGFMAAVGTVTIALDASHLRKSVVSGNVKLAGPGFIVVAFGVALVGVAFLVGTMLARAMKACDPDAGPPLVATSVAPGPAALPDFYTPAPPTTPPDPSPPADPGPPLAPPPS